MNVANISIGNVDESKTELLKNWSIVYTILQKIVKIHINSIFIKNIHESFWGYDKLIDTCYINQTGQIVLHNNKAIKVAILMHWVEIQIDDHAQYIEDSEFLSILRQFTLSLKHLLFVFVLRGNWI